MLFFYMFVLPVLLLLHPDAIGNHFCVGYTAADDMDRLARGSAKILLGALKGQTDLIRVGMNEEGDVHAVLEPRYGSTLFKIGQPWLDYPKWPALHIAMSAGQHAHLNAAFFLMKSGASVNTYQEYVYSPSHDLDHGYAPALVYPLGFGGNQPSQSHAALLQRLITTVPDKFNMSQIEEWQAKTDNPPLMHIPTLLGFGGGVHVLVNDFHVAIDQVDAHGLASTHVAAWTGDLSTLAVLLSNGANRSAIDRQGRTPLHYAVMRRSMEAVDMLMILEERIKLKTGGEGRLDKELARQWRRKTLARQDSEGRTALDYASMTPRSEALVARLLDLMSDAGAPAMGSVQGDTGEKVDCEGEEGEEEEEDGGWYRLPHTCSPASGVARWAGPNAPQREDFLRDHFVVQRPLLLANSPLQDQHIWAYWRRQDLLARYGADKGKMFSSGTSSRTGGRMTVADFVELHMPLGGRMGADEEEKRPVLVTQELESNLLDDVRRPGLFDLCGRRDQEQLSLLVGPHGAQGPVQRDNASWHAVVVGTITWTLWPPVGVTKLDTYIYGDLIDPTEIHGAGIRRRKRRAVPKTWDTQSELAEHDGFNLTQRQGEVLYLPHDWARLARMETGDAVVVSQEFCTLWHTDTRMMPLGRVIFGGHDSQRGKGRMRRDYSKIFKNEDVKNMHNERGGLPIFDYPSTGLVLE